MPSHLVSGEFSQEQPWLLLSAGPGADPEFLCHVESLSYIVSFWYPIRKPVRDVILITEKSQSAVAPTSFFNEYRLHCMYFYYFSNFDFYCKDLCK